MNSRRCYISKSYPDTSTGGNKAKTDIEYIMDKMGFVNLGLKQSVDKNVIKRYLLTLIGVIKYCFLIRKNDIIVLQYPFKKYYSFLCKIAHLKGAVVVTLIHDLGAFRRKKISPKQEKKRLANSDYLIALNSCMKEYLVNSGYKQPIGILSAWDYLSETQPIENKKKNPIPEVIYAGSLPQKKHSFIYKLDEEILPKSYKYSIYGNNFDTKNIKQENAFENKGFVCSDDIIKNTTGDYGLVWYGHSIYEIDGVYGEYLKLTTAHKPSLYICCHIPIIVWSKSAQADFIKQNNIGICIDSLDQLDTILPAVKTEEYNKMRNNTIQLSKKLRSGYFFKKAFLEAERTMIENKRVLEHSLS